MKTRRFRPGMEYLSSRIVPSDLGTVVGGIGNPMSPAEQGPTGQTSPGTLPLAPPFCGGGTSSGTTSTSTVVPAVALVA